MRTITSVLIAVLLLALIAGCSNSAKVASSSGDKLYDLRATVVSVDAEKNSVTLDHEDIPGLMRAMKMSFPVEDAKVLVGLKAGDKVEGKLKACSDGRQVVTELKQRGE